MRKGFLMTGDAVLSLILISVTIIVTNQLLINKPSYNYYNLQSLADDASLMISMSGLNKAQEVINLAPDNTCLTVTIARYSSTALLNQTQAFKTNCPPLSKSASSTISKRTYTSDNYYYIITVQGWYTREKD